jgi:SAM-dependent methyltransferase
MSKPVDRPDAVLSRVEALYTAGLSEHGPTARAIGWRDEETRVLRYQVMANVLAGDRGPLSVLDWGCGYGGLFTYLVDDLGVDVSHYDGYDLSAEMIAAAGRVLPPDRTRLVRSDALSADGDADYSFVSGTFNVRYEATDEQWLAYVQSTLTELWAHSRKGLAFNLLSTYVDWREPHLYYGDPAAFFDFCKRTMSRRVSLYHDYPLFEWTISVRR